MLWLEGGWWDCKNSLLFFQRMPHIILYFAASLIYQQFHNISHNPHNPLRKRETQKILCMQKPFNVDAVYANICSTFLPPSATLTFRQRDMFCSKGWGRGWRRHERWWYGWGQDKKEKYYHKHDLQMNNILFSMQSTREKLSSTRIFMQFNVRLLWLRRRFICREILLSHPIANKLRKSRSENIFLWEFSIANCQEQHGTYFGIITQQIQPNFTRKPAPSILCRM